MYWPNGVLRVYAVNGPEIQKQQKRQQQQEEEETEQDDNRTETTAESADEGEQSNGLLQHEHQEIAIQHAGDADDAWADEPIAGLCVSKSGALFATMTRSSLAIWQTKVRLSLKDTYGIYANSSDIAHSRRCGNQAVSCVYHELWPECSSPASTRLRYHRCTDAGGLLDNVFDCD